MLFRYRERFGLSHNDAIQEPWEEIQRAHYIWSLEGERAKLEARRQEFKSGRTE